MFKAYQMSRTKNLERILHISEEEIEKIHVRVLVNYYGLAVKLARPQL